MYDRIEGSRDDDNECKKEKRGREGERGGGG